MTRHIRGSALAILLTCAGLNLIGGGAAAQTLGQVPSGTFPPWSHPYGLTYEQWSAQFWAWALGQPVEGHPFVDSPSFDVAAGQSGKVWYLATPLDGNQAVTTTHRTCSIPAGKALFVSMLSSEWSDLEGFPSEAEQIENAIFFGDHIVNAACSLDGVPIWNLDAFRFLSPPFTFWAPSPWIFGPTGGAGTAVADGYYVFLKPLSIGQHVLHISGAFHFSVAEGDPFDFDAAVDTTYDLQVVSH